MSTVLVVALSESASTGLLTVAPVAIVAGLLLWYFAARRRKP